MTQLVFLVGAAVVFSLLERAYPARPQRALRRELHVDVLFYVGQVVAFNAAIVKLLVLVAGAASALPLQSLRSAFASLPWGAQAFTVMLGCDLCVYWFHRLQHRCGPLWRFHRVHHTSETLDWVAAFREHPVDGALTRLVENLPAIVLGFQFGAMAGLVVFRGLWGLVIHANFGLRMGPLEWLLGSPRLHHWHHERSQNNRVNFANLNPLMDRLFGTFYDPPGVAPRDFGAEVPVGRGYVALLAEPLYRASMSSTPVTTSPTAQRTV